MSTPRFPRTRIYRDLARLETEVRGWSAEYASMARAALDAHDQGQLSERSDELHYLAVLIHQAADQAGGVYRLRLHEPVLVRRLAQ